MLWFGFSKRTKDKWIIHRCHLRRSDRGGSQANRAIITQSEVLEKDLIATE